MTRKIVGTLLVLAIATSSTSSSFKFRDEDYSEEDLDYGKEFNVKKVDWESNADGKAHLNLQGSLRNRFAMDAALSNPEKSFICSPISALLPLGKLALGAEGKSLRQILSVIGLSSQAQILKAYKPLISSLQYLKGVTLNIISKIYVSKDLKLRSKFRKRAKKIFNSAITTADFSAPAAAAREINDWVKKNTKNMIPSIISEHEISPSTSLILINAVYFKGLWKHPFEKIKEEEFFSPPLIRRLPMMTRVGRYRYSNSEALDAQVVEIPYEGEEASFVIILPNSKYGLTVLLHKIKLAPRLLENAIQNLISVEMTLTIPKFKTQTEIDLTVAYEKLGLRDIFQTGRSGLEKIVRGEKNIYVSSAVQKAVIEVNEVGTKAAASSASEFQYTALQVTKIIVNANHPFMYIIKCKGEQLITGVFSY